MQIKINDVTWNFRFVDEIGLPPNYHGICNSETLEVRVLKTLNDEHKRKTTIHELTHALLTSQGRTYMWKDMCEEDVCEFMSWNADIIMKLADFLLTCDKEE